MWYQNPSKSSVIVVALTALLVILFMQDYLVSRPKLMHRIRYAYLTFTVVFIGWYSLGAVVCC